jgi:hypothetical protein
VERGGFECVVTRLWIAARPACGLRIRARGAGAEPEDIRAEAEILVHGQCGKGHVLAQEAWERLALPALAAADECRVLEHFWGREPIVRRRGEALQPEREGVAVQEGFELPVPQLF